MNVQNRTGPEQLNQILELLRGLEARVNRIEEYLEIRTERLESRSKRAEIAEQEASTNGKPRAESDESWEFKIGAYWLAHLGTAVLLMGIVFFISYPFKTITPIVTSLIGYLAVGGMIGLSSYWQKSNQYLSRILFGGSLVLLYITTLRLHFLNTNPVISNKAVGLFALVAVLSVIFYLSIRRKSELLTGITLFLGYATALISDTTHFTLGMITLTSAASVYVLIRYNWQSLTIVSMVFAYFAHLLWMLNNPLLGKPLQAITEHHNNLIYLFAYGALFASANLLRNKSAFTDFSEFLLTAINSVGFFAIASLAALTFFKPHLDTTNLLIAAFFIAAAVLNWIHHSSKYATSIYACFGYLALSIAIFARFDSPEYFIWLGWQSLLVISTAIWFRSRIIVVVNILIYLGIFLGYLRFAPSNGLVNLSYAIIALTSARVLNWKKERLELKTDMIRNAYLASAFVVVLYGLYQAIPSHYVSLAWLGAALFYFGMSQLLDNIKYRWMAILTIFATIIHVFFIDMAKLDAAFRIVLFLAVGLVLLVVSLLYTRYRKKTVVSAH